MFGSQLRGFSVLGLVLALAACAPAGRDEGPAESSPLVAGFDFVHVAQGPVSDVRAFTVEGSAVRVVTWNEAIDGGLHPHYAIDLGRGWSDAKRTSYEVPLRRRRVEPSRAPQSRDVRPASKLHLVQFATQPLEAYWNAVRTAGASVHQYLHGNAQLVRAGAAAVDRLSELPFVRAIVPLEAADKLDPRLFEHRGDRVELEIVLVDPLRDRAPLVERIVAMGGKLLVNDPASILLEAEVAIDDAVALASLDEVLWLEPRAPMSDDFENARIQGGANALGAEARALPGLPGYTGVGIRGHVLEGITPTHPDFAANDHRLAPVGIDAIETDAHGHNTYGIVFGSGAGNPTARGLLPDAQGLFTNKQAVMGGPAGGRASLVARLIGEHRVMFQTASWGNDYTKAYGARSAELDALILRYDLPITQSQANMGSQFSRAQAWSKNVISVGALKHYGTVDPEDDRWLQGGSIGPAADGRIKPDLVAYFDGITTTAQSGYTDQFGGTSGATPIVAGYVGLTIELWTNGVLGNPVVPAAPGEDIASYRFKNRPHATTTKALLIHSAKQYAFSGEAHDRTRVHQGWGFPDVAGLYARRQNLLVVDEGDVLTNLSRREYAFEVPEGAPDFRATLVYADKEATVTATVHRVNNLDLKVTAPDGAVYFGNVGLKANMHSTPGGAPNRLDTVENVFVPSPRAGTWRVEVIADEINADTHLETPEVDADYALVVSSGPIVR